MSSVQLPELRELNPQSQQWWGLKILFFFKKNSNSCNFTNQDIGKQTAPFSPCPVPSTDPADNAPSPQPFNSFWSLSYSTSPTCTFNHFYFQQVKHWTLSIEKRAIYPLHLFSFLYDGYKYIKCNMVNLFPLWHTNIYKPLSSSLPALECQQQNLCDPVLNLKTNKF